MWLSGMIGEFFELVLFDTPNVLPQGPVINAMLRTTTYQPWDAPWYRITLNGEALCAP